MKKRLAILASGAGSNAQNVINHFSNSDLVDISLIVCNKPSAGVLQIAENEGIKGVFIPTDKCLEPEILATVLKEAGIEMIVLAGFLLRIPGDVIQYFDGKIINIHPALLPKYGGKGMYGHFVHESVHRNHEKESGITIHEVNEHYDEGHIVFQARVALDPLDTPKDIERKVRELEILHFPTVIEKWVTDKDSAKNAQKSLYSP